MNAEIMSASGVGLEVTNLITPFISALVLLVVTLWFKDFATKIAKGMAFKMNKSFNEGDTVILDGSDALIVKIGLSETVFGVYSDKGYTWRYVPNERIPMLKLEKVINKDLHLDTDEEKAAKLQALIDSQQDSKISANKEAIEEIKNGNGRKKRV
jgi:hypothetical protein|tara:strand:- start:107 stop:571 length:465 start_codon:yes stop_codon:yes gene_type:complete